MHRKCKIQTLILWRYIRVRDSCVVVSLSRLQINGLHQHSGIVQLQSKLLIYRSCNICLYFIRHSSLQIQVVQHVLQAPFIAFPTEVFNVEVRVGSLLGNRSHSMRPICSNVPLSISIGLHLAQVQITAGGRCFFRTNRWRQSNPNACHRREHHGTCKGCCQYPSREVPVVLVFHKNPPS